MEITKKPLIFEKLDVQYYPAWGTRPRTQMFPIKMNFIFLNGGMGDLINWMQPIRWLASEATWIEGTLIHPIYMNELADYWLKTFPKWRHATYRDVKDIPKIDDVPFRGPVMLQQESLNATGAHLFTCGWVYFTNKEGPPEGNSPDGFSWNSYPRIEQAHLDAVLKDFPHALPEKYVVITTGITTPSRHVPPTYWNHVIEYVHAQGLVPVFLGKRIVETGNQTNIHTQYGSELRLDLGLDLLDKTSLMQAAAVMSRARLVVGHDNGLLHLAACTDVPIVFGYNLASPAHREPKRPHLPHNGMFNVQLTDTELPCNFCQSRLNFIIGFNFRTCMYNDNKCIDLLFANQAEKWKTQIDRALGET